MTTTAQIRQSVRRLPPQSHRLDNDTAARLAIAYGLILYALLPPRDLLARLAEIGIEGEQASEFVATVAAVDITMGGAS